MGRPPTITTCNSAFPAHRSSNAMGMRTAITALTVALVTLSASAVQGKDISEQMIQRLNAMTPEQAVAMKYGWDIPGQYVYCAGSLPIRELEVPVLACQWGPGANVITDRYLFWKVGRQWRSEPYPREGIRGTAGFTRLYQKGNDLVVVMNVGIAQTRYAEQPQLLRRSNGGWRLIWVPPDQEWSGSSSTVQFEGDSLHRFSVSTDRSVLPKEQLWPFAGEFGLYLERWQRSGDKYVRISRTEAPQPELALVHFVQALGRGNEAEAGTWVTDPLIVRKGKVQGIPKAAATGFVQPKAVHQENGNVTFELTTNNYERKPSWLVTVTWHEGRWLVSDIRPGVGNQPERRP